MDIDNVKLLLLNAGTRGPDGAESLIAHFDLLVGDTQQQFYSALSHATQRLLADGTLEANDRDMAFNNAAHVLHHVQKTVTPEASDEPLRLACITWTENHPYKGEDHSSWFAYGSVLRLLRLTGHADSSFWRKEFEFWVTQFTKSPQHFSLICRCIMQTIRALGASESLDSTNLGSLFGHGLRAQNFPVHEVYAALEEISRETKRQGLMASENGKESLFGTVLRDANDASSIDAMPQLIAPENLAQKDKTLRSWRVHCLGLPAIAMVSTASQSTSPRRQLKAPSYDQLMAA